MDGGRGERGEDCGWKIMWEREGKRKKEKGGSTKRIDAFAG